MKTVIIAVNKFGCRGLWSGVNLGQDRSSKRGEHHAKNQAKKSSLRGILEPSNGNPIATRTIQRGMNHRCPCGSGKKSRNCCKLPVKAS